MATEVIMPALGMAQETGRLLAWLRREGDPVRRGEPLIDVETDKARVEVEAPADGVLAAVRVAAEAEVPVGTVLAWIVTPGEAVPAAGGPAPAPPAAAEGVAAAPPASPPGAAGSVDPLSPADAGGGASGGRVRASPRARRLASDRGLDLRRLAGSGPAGAVVARDLPAAVAAGEPSPFPEEALRRRMAEHTTRVWITTPHFYLARDVRAARLTGWVTALRRRGLEATVTDVLLLVLGAAVAAHPAIRDHWAAGGVRRHRAAHLGLAVATERGLLVVVVPEAATRTMAAVVAARRLVVERARGGRLHADDALGAVVTLSNLGPQGVDAFGAVLPEGQSAILAAGRVRDRVLADAGRAAVEPALSLTLTCDHRVLDGARAAAFLATVVETLEEPALLLDGPR